MFAIFRKRASKFLTELIELRKKEVALGQRAKDHIESAYQVINTLYVEIDEAQVVVDELEGEDSF